jgi:ribosomal protein L32
MRHTKSHTRNRRSHHKVKASSLTRDTQSGVTHLRHRASLDTGEYRGRKVVDAGAKVAKKHAKMKAAQATSDQASDDKKSDKKPAKKSTQKKD